MPEQKTSKQQMLLISAGLILLIGVAFEPLRYNGFVNYDDNRYIVENRHIQPGFTHESVIWAFTTGHASNWHPLTWLSHLIDIELFGLDPLGHHLHNLLLHTTSTVLLFWLLHRMTGAVWRSAFVAMAFGVHPLRVESIAWAAERKDVLSMLFFMLTVAAYLYYVKRGGIGRYLLIVLCFIMGLMAKPILVTLPIVLLILDFWPLERIQKGASENHQKSNPGESGGKQYRPAPLSDLIAEKIPLFILAFASCIVTYAVQKAGCGINSIAFHTRIFTAVTGYITYIGRIFWPQNLAVLYPYPETGLPIWQVAAAFTGMLAISGSVFLCRHHKPYLLTGWLWYVVTMIPVIGLVHVGSQWTADRYTYLPSIGITLMITWTTVEFLSAKRRYCQLFSTLTGGIIILALVIATRLQLSYWQNSVILYEHTLSITQNNYIIHTNLGWSLIQQNEIDKATHHIQKALQICPDFPPANDNLAIICMLHQRNDEAISYLHKALNADPDDIAANRMMGLTLLEEQRFDEAMEHFYKVLKVSPDEAEVYYSVGIILATQGKMEEAIQAYEQAVRCKQNYYKAFNNLGAIKAQQGLWDQAIAYFQRCLQINPNYAQSHRNIGLVLQTQGRTEDAIPYFRAALAIDSRDYPAYYNLACSLHETGKLQDAITAYRETLQLNPNSAEALSDLARILSATADSTIQKPAEALSLAQKACQLTEFKEPSQLDTLAVAYAAAGQFKKAAETAQKAIDTANTAGQTDLASRIEQRLKLYQAGKPYQSQ
jgi:tetratricopeptide (TPR) repeat protein